MPEVLCETPLVEATALNTTSLRSDAVIVTSPLPVSLRASTASATPLSTASATVTPKAAAAPLADEAAAPVMAWILIASTVTASPNTASAPSSIKARAAEVSTAMNTDGAIPTDPLDAPAAPLPRRMVSAKA